MSDKSGRWKRVLRETIPIMLSIGAFAMSGFTFYDQYLRKEVELWAQLLDVGIRNRISEDQYPRVEAVFLNKGNVAAVIFALRIRPAIFGGRAADCRDGEMAANWQRLSIGTDRDFVYPRPLIVRPGEALSATVDFDPLGTESDLREGLCLTVGYLSAAARVQLASFWLRASFDREDLRVLPPKPRRLADSMLEIVDTSQHP